MGRTVSPCILVCQLDRATGWCLGCGRSGDEIAAWPRLDDRTRERLMAALPPRLAALGLPADPAARKNEGERRAMRQRLA